MSEKRRPFFSIGVTTYDRLDLLKETLSSIILQTFRDFEVVVGNDNPQRSLTPELLNIFDERIRFINRTDNLGEMANMADLLEKSHGRYFTWLADDDLYVPAFLETVHKALMSFENQPAVIFTSYMTGAHFKDEVRSVLPAECRLYPGSEFLKNYLSQSIKAIGCYGVFKKEYLQKIGGMEKLGQGFSPYADNWLVIKTGMLEQVGYINSPLVFFRTHDKSISFTSPEVAAYLSAQQDLLSKSRNLFLSKNLRKNFQDNVSFLLVWCIRDFGAVLCRSRSVRAKHIWEYVTFLKEYISTLKNLKLHLKIWLVLMKTVVVVALKTGGKIINDLISFITLSKRKSNCSLLK